MPRDEQKRRFAGACLEWLATVPEESKEWAEALLVAALDTYPDDLDRVLATAKEALAHDPQGP